jgi:Secretion system C-terminal sorting domain
MKRFYVLSLALVSFTLASAQNSSPRPVTGSTPVVATQGQAPLEKTNGDLDTLQQYFLNASGFTIYNAPGGYVFGTNFDSFGNANIDATGLHFDSVGDVTVNAVYGWFARKHIIGAPDVLVCELYTAAPDSMPNTLLGFGNCSMAFLDTNVSINFSTLLGFQVIPISQGTNAVNEDFFISMNYTGFNDTLGLVSTVTGDGLQQKRCRILLGQLIGGTWTRAWDFWNIGGLPIDADPVFFPIVEFPDSAASVGQAFSARNLKLYPVSPNPVVDDAVIRFELSKPDRIQVWVLDANGRFVYDSGIVAQSMGTHEIRIDANQLASGTYYYTAVTSETTISSRFVVP